MKKKYATATGLYEEEDFGGPPSLPFEEVYSAAEVEAALQGIRKMAWHCIPFYAYGDNQAACDMANRLEWIEQRAVELTHKS